MAIRDRITEFQNYLTRQIKFSAGNRLLGRVSGAGMGQEITIGTRLTISGTTLSADSQVSDTAYDPTSWNGVTSIAPSKNAVRDKLETMAGGIVSPTALTYAGVNPNIPLNLTVTGITDPINSSPLEWAYVGDLFGKPTYTDGSGWGAEYTGTQWLISKNGEYDARKTSSALTPVGLTVWTLADGAGQPVVTGDAPIATFLGQLCKATTAWWQWDGSAWLPRFTLNGRPITRNDADDAYFSLGVDSIGLPSTTPFP